MDMATAPRKDCNLASNNPAEYDCSRSIFVGNIPFDVEVCFAQCYLSISLHLVGISRQQWWVGYIS